MLRRTLSAENEIWTHRRYTAGEIDEDVARVLLGDALEEIDRERAAFEAVMELDTDDAFQDCSWMAVETHHTIITDTDVQHVAGKIDMQ